MTLVKFTDIYKVDVYINPDLVTFMRESATHQTVINFGDSHSVTVEMKIESVASALFNAGKP